MDKDDKWIGPGIVQAVESKTIFLTYNGNLKKVATCQARPWDDNNEYEDEKTVEDESDKET